MATQEFYIGSTGPFTIDTDNTYEDGVNHVAFRGVNMLLEIIQAINSLGDTVDLVWIDQATDYAALGGGSGINGIKLIIPTNTVIMDANDTDGFIFYRKIQPTGAIFLPNDVGIWTRNAADTADLVNLYMDGSNILNLGNLGSGGNSEVRLHLGGVTSALKITSTATTSLAPIVAKADADGTNELGRAKVGSVATDVMGLGHYDTFTQYNAAVAQTAAGATQFGAASGQSFNWYLGNSTSQLALNSSALTVTPVIKVIADSDGTNELGRAKLGSVASDVMGLGHYDRFTQYNASVAQTAAGATQHGAASGQAHTWHLGTSTAVGTLSSTGLTITGTSNSFSSTSDGSTTNFHGLSAYRYSSARLDIRPTLSQFYLYHSFTGSGQAPIRFDWASTTPSPRNVELYRVTGSNAGDMKFKIFSPNTSTENFVVDAKTGDVTSLGDLDFSGTGNIDGATTLGSTLDVTDDTTIGGDLTVSGTIQNAYTTHKIAVAYNSGTVSFVTLPANTIVMACYLVVGTAWNNTLSGISVKVGTAADDDAVCVVAGASLAVTSQAHGESLNDNIMGVWLRETLTDTNGDSYYAPRTHLCIASTDIQVKVAAGTATQGAGTVYLVCLQPL